MVPWITITRGGARSDDPGRAVRGVHPGWDDVPLRRALNGVVACHRGAHAARSRGDLEATVGNAGYTGDGLRRGRVAGRARGFGRHRSRELERHRASAGGGNPGAGAVLRRVAHRSRATASRGRGAGAIARDRTAADDRARRPRGGRHLRPSDRRRDRDPGNCVGADRRRAGAGGCDRTAHPGEDPPGAERREWAQRRYLRAAAVRSRGAGRRGVGDLGGPQRRDAAARGDRLRSRRRSGGRAGGRRDRYPRRPPRPDRACVAAGDFRPQGPRSPTAPQPRSAGQASSPRSSPG